MDPIGVDDDQLEVMRREAADAHFRSPEARAAFARARRRRMIFWCVGLPLLVGWSVVMYRAGQSRVDDRGSGPPASGQGQPVKLDPAGDPGAKMKITCILPGGSDCHSPVVDLLTKAATKRPAQIRVEFTGMEEVGQDKVTQQVGSYCAAVLINGTSEITVNKEGKNRHVSLVGTVPTHYSLMDLADCVQSEFTRIHGDPGEPVCQLPEGAAAMAAEQSDHAHPQDTMPPSGAAIDFALPKPSPVDLRK